MPPIQKSIPIQKKEKAYYTRAFAELTPSAGYPQLDWQSLKASHAFIGEVKKLRKRLSGNNVLDLGCGIGRLAIPLAKLGFQVWGIDFALPAIRHAKVFAKKKGVFERVHFRVGNVLSLPYKEGFFDLIIDYGCLHHISQQYWCLYRENVTHVLKSTGFILLYTHGFGSPFYRENVPKTGIKEFVVENVLTHFFMETDFQKVFGDEFTLIFAKLARHPATPKKLMWTILLQKT